MKKIIDYLESSGKQGVYSTTITQPKEIDWEQRRYEIAKGLYCRHLEVCADSAVKCADQLIEELKKTSKC